jgi:hypothetical protein
LCDNFSIVDLAQAVRLSNGKLPLEASGNIDETTLDLVLAANGTQQQVLVFCKMLGVQCLMKMAHSHYCRWVNWLRYQVCHAKIP